MKLPYALLTVILYILVSVSIIYSSYDNSINPVGHSDALVDSAATNSPPVIVADEYIVHGNWETPVESPVSGVLKNDSDPENDPLHCIYQQVQTPIGIATIFYNGKVAFIPGYGQAGTATISYTACDISNACTQGTVTFHVVNQAPLAGSDRYIVRDDSFETPMETPNGVLKNDFDPDGDQIQIFNVRVDYPQGSAFVYSTGKAAFVRTPGWSNYEGTFSIQYVLRDNLGAQSQGNVTFHLIAKVNSENDGITCNAIGEPVNVTNGNVFLSQTDFRLPGAGPAIDLTRTYNSNSVVNRLFGKGWSTPYDESVTVIGASLLRLTLGDGRAVYFGRDIGSSAPYMPLVGGFYGQLVQSGGGFTLMLKDGSIHQFNTTGKLLSITDGNANQTSLTYDGSGKLTSITDPFGRSISFFTNASGQVTSVSDSTGTVATYTYGGSAQLLSVTYADNSLFQFTYNTTPRLTSITDALGNLLETHTYDSQGRALTSARHGGVELYSLIYLGSTQTQVTDALGRVTKYTFDKSKGRNLVTKVEGNCSCGTSQVQTWAFDAQLNLLSETDALNHTATYTYDENGNRLTQTDPTGTITFTYNTFGEVLTRTDQMGGVTTNTYDAHGNLLTTRDALNNITTFIYDSRGQLLTLTDARGKLTTLTWDTSGRLTQHKDAANNITNFGYDIRAQLTSRTNALSQTTSYEYDSNGRLKKIIYPDTNFILFTYDLAGRCTKIKDPRGNETSFAYDGAYRLTSRTDAANQTTSFGYDLMSNVISKTDALSRVTNYDYDDFNRLKRVIYPPEAPGITRQQETLEYDLVGNISKKTDTAGRNTTYLYDTANRLTKITDPLLQATQFEYNARSQTTKVIDALNQQYVFAYDPLGRMTQTSRAGSSMSYVYDAVGNRNQRTDYNGAVTNYTFDDLNRLTNITYPDSTSATYDYDALSRLTMAANQNGAVSFVYDSRNRIASSTDVWGQTVGYGYDANGNRTSITLAGNGYASYQYDVVNRLTNLADSVNQNFAYNYDVANRLTSRGAPNGVTTSFSYDGLGRLSELTHTKAPITLSTNQYGYSSANNIASWLDSSGNRSFSYDSNDRLVSVSAPGPSESYGYDAVGNRTTSHLSGTYGHQALNKLISTSSASYTYDNNGNLLSKTDGSGTRNFTWDSENRLKQVTLPAGLIVTYKYDALGRRIARMTNAGADDRFVYDGQDVLLDLDSNLAITTRYLNGSGIDEHLRQTNTTTGVSYFLTDHLGTTSALTDASGTIVETLSYDSFGNNAGSARTRYTYTGREHDLDTGLIYYRARFYDPELGRFISEDPIGLAGGINFFAYVTNNPARYTDPRGLCPQDTDPESIPGRGNTKQCSLTVSFQSGDFAGVKGFPNGPSQWVDPDLKKTVYGLGFTVTVTVPKGDAVSRMGNDTVPMDTRGNWTVDQWASAYSSYAGGFLRDRYGREMRGGPAFRDISILSPSTQRDNTFSWWDHPGTTIDKGSYANYQFVVKAYNGRKYCEAIFWMTVREDGSVHWGSGKLPQ